MNFLRTWIHFSLIVPGSLFAATAQAQLTNIQFTTTTANGQVTITGFSATGDGPLVIPEAIDGLPVTAIGPGAFENSMTMTSAEIPASVTTIGENAFENCSLLDSVAIPDSATVIGAEAFAYCTSLSSVAIPAGVTSISSGAFENCTSLRSVMLLTGLISIEPGAFENCTSLGTVTIPASVTNMGNESFDGCSSLTGAIFEGSAPTMGQHVFLNAGNSFAVYYRDPGTGFKSPLWTDSSGDTYPAIDFPVISPSRGAELAGGGSGATGSAMGRRDIQPVTTHAPPDVTSGNAGQPQGNSYQAVNDSQASQPDSNDKLTSEESSMDLQKRQNLAETFMDKGLGAWFKKDFDLALVDLNKAILLDPKFLAAYCNRSFIYLDRGDFDKAIADCCHAIQINPNFALAYYNRGEGYRLKGDYKRAIADMSKAAGLAPNRTKIYFDRGLAYFDAGDNDRAIADLSQDIHPDPHYAAASTGSDSGAEDPVNQGYAWIDPNPEYPNYYRGMAYLEKGDNAKAIADFNEAIKQDPKNADAYAKLGEVYGKMGEYDKAIANYTQSIRLSPKNVEAYNNLAWIEATCPHAELRDGQKAVENATNACELTNWKNPLFVDSLAAADAEVGNFIDAIKWENQYLGSRNLSSGETSEARERLAHYQAKQAYHENN